ncbi:hypothetical protein TNCV_539641 [Trichonephila clavipes]|nr:hypothetical protein TNCV_539641 [Trichonephila clavipes]
MFHLPFLNPHFHYASRCDKNRINTLRDPVVGCEREKKTEFSLMNLSNGSSVFSHRFYGFRVAASKSELNGKNEGRSGIKKVFRTSEGKIGFSIETGWREKILLLFRGANYVKTCHECSMRYDYHIACWLDS